MKQKEDADAGEVIRSDMTRGAWHHFANKLKRSADGLWTPLSEGVATHAGVCPEATLLEKWICLRVHVVGGHGDRRWMVARGTCDGPRP